MPAYLEALELFQWLCDLKKQVIASPVIFRSGDSKHM